MVAKTGSGAVLLGVVSFADKQTISNGQFKPRRFQLRVNLSVSLDLRLLRQDQ